LRACSLVTKPWVYPAQRRLFSSITIPLDFYQSWKRCISPSNTELLGHVRSLHYFAWIAQPLHWTLPRIDAFIDYMPSFLQLQSLTLCGVRVKSDFSEQVEMFSAFQHTLSSLSLHDISLPWASFTAVINYFPNIKNLDIQDPFFSEGDQQQTPSRPLLGRLSIALFTGEAIRTFSNWLSGTQVAYNELVIDAGVIPRLSYQLIIDACGKSLKRLEFGSLGPPPDLSHCPELCQLEFHTITPEEMEPTIISSIISTSIRTIILKPRIPMLTSRTLLTNRYWASLDGVLHGLVGKLRALGYGHTLELEFHFDFTTFVPDLDYCSGLLPKFREQGQVRILNTSSGAAFEVI